MSSVLSDLRRMGVLAFSFKKNETPFKGLCGSGGSCLAMRKLQMKQVPMSQGLRPTPWQNVNGFPGPGLASRLNQLRNLQVLGRCFGKPWGFSILSAQLF